MRRSLRRLRNVLFVGLVGVFLCTSGEKLGATWYVFCQEFQCSGSQITASYCAASCTDFYSACWNACGGMPVMASCTDIDENQSSGTCYCDTFIC
jgi:hypothetical protein